MRIMKYADDKYGGVISSADAVISPRNSHDSINAPFKIHIGDYILSEPQNDYRLISIRNEECEK